MGAGVTCASTAAGAVKDTQKAKRHNAKKSLFKTSDKTINIRKKA
jgi:hypothetical protein